jgi:phenylacetate-CoA ligase
MAWKDVCERFPDAELVICGGDHMDGHLQRLAVTLGISERVRFMGEVPRSRIVGLMRDCLFQVHPSRNEAFGMAVLEGLACGKAVLATRSGGPEDLIEDGVSGVLVQPFSAGALRDGLSAFLSDPRRCEQMGAKARALTSAYNWGAISRAYLDLATKGEEIAGRILRKTVP